MRTITSAAARPALLVSAIALAALLAACAAGEPSGSAPSGSGGPSASPTARPSPGILDSAAAAAKLVAAKMPLFEGIGPKDPELIGQANWYEATPAEAAKPPVAWRVVFHVGWGDCPSGCIDEHTWTYDVEPDGSVTLVGETGPSLPQDVIDGLRAASTFTGVTGRVTAGPTCPVENPNDPTSCQERPVAGALLVVTGAGGVEVARLASDSSGEYALGLQPGDYTLTPQPVQGLMGTPSPITFTVADGMPTVLDVSYDTGIR